MSYRLFVLDVRLKYIAPPIWRTIELPGIVTLADVHYAVQVAMGWTNSHLHQFTIDGRIFGMKGLDEDAPRELEDERQVRLEDVATEGSSFAYDYDFGDGWDHVITVKSVTTTAKLPPLRCVAGERACPPEDSGGPHGYPAFVEILANPEHPRHAELVEWAGTFDPEAFAVPRTGRNLRREMTMLRNEAERGYEEAEASASAPDALGIPTVIIDAVLALDPRQRASLCGLLAASLAHDVESAARMVMTSKAHAKPKSSRAHRHRRS